MILKLSHFRIPGHLLECFREQGAIWLLCSKVYNIDELFETGPPNDVFLLNALITLLGSPEYL